MKSWYPLSKVGKLLLVLLIATLVICYGPWTWANTPGTIGFLYWSQLILLVVTPIIAIFLMSRAKDKEEEEVKEGKK